MRSVFLSAVLTATILAAQTQSSFEVASIKPAAPDARGTSIRPGPGGGISITNMTLKELIVSAWRVQPFQISGGPAWLDTLHFDIVAKPETRTTPTEFPSMLQALLKDRFQLVLRQEAKEAPIYALVLSRKDGKLGPGLSEAKEGSCTPPDPSRPPPPPEPGKPPMPGCGGMRMSPREMNAWSAQIGDLAPMLSRILGRKVIDQTGLTGKYDVTMTWTPDESQGLQPPPGALPPTPADAGGPSIFTAFQEQLGLKLEAQKAPIEMLIIERAEKPSEN